MVDKIGFILLFNSLVQLRNPHGIGHWTGEWGPDSDAWEDVQDDDFSEEHRGDSEDNGIFWMNATDFVRYFT